MIKENDLAAMSDSDLTNDQKIAQLIQSLQLDTSASFIEIEVRNEKGNYSAAV